MNPTSTKPAPGGHIHASAPARPGVPQATTAPNRKVNTVLAAWACIVLGSGIILTSGASPFALTVAAPLAIAGVVLLFVGLGMAVEENVDPDKVAAWEPEAGKMPDAGRVMYRVDTTLEDPVRTSILCGRCGRLDWVEGPKPKSHACSECDTLLWESEEE